MNLKIEIDMFHWKKKSYNGYTTVSLSVVMIRIVGTMIIAGYYQSKRTLLCTEELYSQTGLILLCESRFVSSDRNISFKWQYQILNHIYLVIQYPDNDKDIK